MGACVVTVEGAAKAPIFQSSTAVSVWTNCAAARSQIANSNAAPGPIAIGLFLGAGLLGNELLFLFADKKVLLVYPRRNGDIEESHHHFVVGLFAPAHLGIRIRIVRIGLRIVVPRDCLKLCSRF